MNDRTASGTTVVKIASQLEIPARPFSILSTGEMHTEAAAKAWGEKHSILTVYWFEGLGLAFGYPGK